MPTFSPDFITATTNPTWYTGVTKLRSASEVKNSYSGNFSSNSTLSKTNFTLTQSDSTYTFAPTATAFPSGYQATYAYKKLNYTIQAGKKYVYCFKLNTLTAGKYTSFLFGEFPSNTASNKMLNNFAVVGGAFTNNGDTNYSDVRLGVGRVEAKTSDVYGSNQNINLYLESTGGKKYSYYRLDIDGLNCTLRVKDYSGAWIQIGGTYSLPSGTQIIMGCASWEANKSRAMSVNDPVCVDVTDISNSISAASTLNSIEYTAESWNAFSAAKTTADYSIKLMNQNILDYAGDSLSAATNQLVKRIDVANGNIAEYEAKSSIAYTNESWAAYTAAYQALVDAKSANDLESFDSLNEAYILARNALVDAVISLEILWHSLDFVYSNGVGGWNPSIHEYDKGDAYWTEYGNDIVVKNSSNVDVSIALEYTPAENMSSISASFYESEALVDEVILAENESKKIIVKLEGSVPSETVDKSNAGAVTLTVSKH
jgi:hypothetical protein